MKKLIALLLAVVMIAALATGCGGNNASTTDSASTSKADTSPTDSESDNAATSDADATAGAPVTISALINYGNVLTVEPQEMPSFQNFEKDMNVKIEWQIIRSGWDEQKTLLLASNDLPDTFWGNRTLTISDIQTNLDSFVRLNDYIEKSDNIKKMFADEPGMESLVTMPDGSIYSLPHRMPLRPDTFDGLYINQTWLDTLGLSVPDTLDGFYETLKAFKEKDPNGNGIADEIPYTFTGTGTSFGPWWIFGTFGLQDNILGGDKIIIRDGKLLYGPAQNEFKEAIKYYKKLYAEGLIDVEAFTQDWGMWQGKCQADPQIVGVAGMWTQTALFGNKNAVDYTVQVPLKGPDGVQRWRSNPTMLRSSPAAWVMSQSCQNKDVAFNLIDYIYNPENSVQLYFGSYGVGLDNSNPDDIKIINPEDSEKSYDDWVWTNSFGDMGPYYVSREFEQKIEPNAWVLDKRNIDQVYQPYLPDPKNIFPVFIYTPEANNEISVLKTDLDRLVKEKFAAWTTNEADIDAEWDSYLEQLDSIGLPRLMEIYNERYQQAQ